MRWKEIVLVSTCTAGLVHLGFTFLEKKDAQDGTMSYKDVVEKSWEDETNAVRNSSVSSSTRETLSSLSRNIINASRLPNANFTRTSNNNTQTNVHTPQPSSLSHLPHSLKLEQAHVNAGFTSRNNNQIEVRNDQGANSSQLFRSKWQEKIKNYQPSVLCSGCYLHVFPLNATLANGSVTSEDVFCGELIYEELEKRKEEQRDNNITNDELLVEVASSIAKEHNRHCYRCDPNHCPPEEKIYRRLDDAAPYTLRAWSLPLSNLIPQENVFPKEGIKDPYAFFSNPENRNKEGRYYHWEYNPSIVDLTKAHDVIPDGILNNTEEVVYFSTQRVSILADAFPQNVTDIAHLDNPGLVWTRYERVVFSFLREDLSVIQDCKFGFGPFDYRLFVLNGELYFAIGNEIKRLKIQKRDATDLRDKRIIKVNGQNWQVFVDPLCPFEIHKSAERNCCSGGCGGGKNFNYFTTKDGSVWVQTQPTEPLLVKRALLPCENKNGTWEGVLPNDTDTSMVTMFQDDRKIDTSFSSLDEIRPPSVGIFINPAESGYRGSTCCVEMTNPLTKETVLVGINHRKQWANGKIGSGNRQYISNFYALPTEPPFFLMALSGAFCMGFPEPAEESENHLVPLARNNVLRYGDVMDCPQITFVSTMVENHANPENVLIGYGINDMMSRVVEASKANIMEMLFHPFSNNLTTSSKALKTI